MCSSRRAKNQSVGSREIIKKLAIPAKRLDFIYTVFGLRVLSNLPISGLAFAPPSNSRPDLILNLGSVPTRDFSKTEEKLRYASTYLDEKGEPSLTVWEVDDGGFLRMSYSDGTEFWLDRDLKTLWAHWPEGLSLANTLSYLVGPVLGLLLRLRGVVCLHASVVAINDRSVVFVGPEGAGKSTTAAAFARQGFAVLSDDIAALVEQEKDFHVLPAYPRINLWPASVQLLYGAHDALPQIIPDWEKRSLTLGPNGATRFEERTLPLGAVYIFGDPADESETVVESISQKAAMLMLIANTYATNFLDAQQRAEEFAVLSRLVSAVPIRKVNPRRGVLRVEELCDSIRQDFDGISPAPDRLL